MTPPPLFPFSYPDFSVSGVAVVVPAVASVYVSPAASALSFCSRASLQSIPGCSHHFWGTRVPPRRSVPSQSPRIGRVATNCATVFCLWRTDVLALTIPASFVAPARGRYENKIWKLVRSKFCDGLSFLFFFWSGLRGPKAYSLWGGVVPSPSIGYDYL